MTSISSDSHKLLKIDIKTLHLVIESGIKLSVGYNSSYSNIYIYVEEFLRSYKLSNIIVKSPKVSIVV